ncbi:Helix-turn-helix domain protein [Coleofasciculus chthonoplastes PCC 7420]|uniref:Helix-turn-helix domain protein n=1 Tax=Coleofasciculus chthonoplastes PCC 7420 TaxID=118168 RepID=B4VL80_9CYAN|nr:helix-turn-helix transcriptional regulator [Coleofasciculus chthonoplastes]EDX77442.1 Helix-turn-helix domain protein [Coleofasciculus chthonoplastes PCC 7420]
MGRVGKALKQVLKNYDISQNKLAVALGVRRSVVYRWYHELTDPTAETVADIAQALKSINPSAAAELIRLYLGEFLESDQED